MYQMNTGNLALTFLPQANGRCVCEVGLSLDGQNVLTKSFQGQNPNHALALALENLAHAFRVKTQAEQNIGWETIERTPSGQVTKQRFHVILHYERVTEEESKFDAMVNTQMGNTVVENAEITIIGVDSDLPKPEWSGDADS